MGRKAGGANNNAPKAAPVTEQKPAAQPEVDQPKQPQEPQAPKVEKKGEASGMGSHRKFDKFK